MKKRKPTGGKTRPRARARHGAGRPRRIALLELLEALARAANEANSPEAAMHACLERIYTYADWDLGRVAILKPGSPAPLIEASLWHGNTRGCYDAFVRESDRYDIARPTGAFISVVVREKRAMWIPDFAKLRASGRLRTALACGLHSGFAFPIIVRGEVAAILEFFAKAPRPVDPRLFGAIGSVGSQLARLIERGRAEAAHSRLATIVECSQDAIVSTAPDRTILTWNAGAERLFGYTAVESLGRDMAFLLPDERRHELGQQRARALAGLQSPPYETERLAKDGRRVPVSICASPLADGAGNVTGVALIYRDIRELKQAQRELERKARLSELMESLARAANEAASPEKAMQSCLELIAGYGNWPLGRVATFAPGQQLGTPQSSVWHCPQRERYSEFMEASNRYAYSGRPTGQFVSEALRDLRPVWVADLSTMRAFGRLDDALKCGLRAGFVFPVVVAGESLAFLEFFADEAREPDTPFLEAISSVSAQLARLIERARANETRAQLAAIVENSDDAIISRDLDRRIVSWNAAAEHLFGYRAAEAIGQSVSLLIPPDQVAATARARELLASGRAVPTTDAVRLTRDGRRIDVSITQSPIKDADGSVVGVSLIFRDISARKQAEEKIRQLAHFDSLTGLPNRPLFYDRLGQAIGLARRERLELGLMYIDLDDFKAVNDTLGHGAGDELLRQVAGRIRARLRESDTVARVGGDEFIAMLLRIASRDDVARIAAKILDALSEPFALGAPGRAASIGASIGIAIFPRDADGVDALVKAADMAMYTAKQSKNTYRFFAVNGTPDGAS